MEPEGSLSHSQEPASCPYPEQDRSSPCPPPPSPSPTSVCMIRDMCLSFYGEELLAAVLTPRLEDHLLSAVRDCSFSIFAATLHIWRPFLHPQPEDAPCRNHLNDTYKFVVHREESTSASQL
jgi:hypothetical protein